MRGVRLPRICRTHVLRGVRREKVAGATQVESKELVGGISTPTLDRIIAEAAQAERAAAATPMPIFTAELEPPQSWAARNKYILVVLLLVAGGIGAILLLAKF